MKWQRLVIAGAVMGAGLTGSSIAASPGSDGHAYVVRRSAPALSEVPEPLRIAVDDDRPFIEVIQRTVVEPAAVVDEALAEQPVYTHLVELHVGPTPILIDPDRDLRRPTGGIDEDHYLLEAQRIYRAAQAKPARVIRRVPSTNDADPQPTILPRAIIHVPHSPQHNKPAPPKPAPGNTPLQIVQNH